MRGSTRGSVSFVAVLAAVIMSAILLAPSASVSADNSMPSSTSSGAAMGDHMAYLIGSWNCTVALAAMMGNPVSTDHGKLTFSVTPNKTIHSHVAAADYAQDSYYGYDAKTKTHWTVSADTQGVIVTETSKDGVTFIGTSMAGGMSTPTRDTFTHPSASTIRDVTQIEMKGKWTQLAIADCTKM